DVTRVRQILVNLLSNAVKFTECGEVEVSIGMTASPVLCHFAVRDTGIGIPEDRKSRLFRAFSQVDASTTRRYGGPGLGLAISQPLSEMMGGSMWVECELGSGSTFHFTFAAKAAPDPVRVHLPAQPPQLGGRRLLIVDDNPTNCKILALQARSWGMIAQEAAG